MWSRLIPPGLPGALGGGGVALARSAGQPTRHRVVETAGGTIAGLGLGSIPDLGRRLLALGKRVAGVFAWGGAGPGSGLGEGPGSGLGEGPGASLVGIVTGQIEPIQGSLRARADRQGALARQAPTPVGHLLHAFLEILLRLLAGAVAGAFGGAALTVLLDYLTVVLKGP